MTAAPPPLDEAFAQAADTCRRALARDFAGLPTGDPEIWFHLLGGVPQDGDAVRRLAAIKREAGREGGIERMAVLGALVAAVPRLRGERADESVKRLFCQLCAEVADPPAAWAGHFALEGAPFAEMAQLATLRRLPAGQLVFDFAALPQSWLLKFHPLDLPGALREIAAGLGGFGPLVSPHLNFWRANPLLLLRREYQRSLWRIARTLDRRPEVRGLMADAWFYAAEVGTLFPHLAWVRRFFLDQGAFFVEMEAARPESGFMVGSARRRQLYEDGRFRPRRTLVLWRRDDMLAWAAAHPDGEDAGPASPRRRPPPVVRPVPQARRPPPFDGTLLLNSRPKLYAAATVLAPALALALAAAAASPWFAPPVFAAAFALAWVAQYFCFQ